MIYAYCRVSTKHQRIARQITNITEVYPNATIIREFYTGTTQSRPHWDRLIAIIKKEDTIVFDSVSRMSRNAGEGFKDYNILKDILEQFVVLYYYITKLSHLQPFRKQLPKPICEDRLF